MKLFNMATFSNEDIRNNPNDYAFSMWLFAGKLEEDYVPMFLAYNRSIISLESFRSEWTGDIERFKSLVKGRIYPSGTNLRAINFDEMERVRFPVSNEKLCRFLDMLHKADDDINGYLLKRSGYKFDISKVMKDMLIENLVGYQMTKLDIDDSGTVCSTSSFAQECMKRICAIDIHAIDEINEKEFITDLTKYEDVERVIGYTQLVIIHANAIILSRYRPPVERCKLPEEIENKYVDRLVKLCKSQRHNDMASINVKHQFTMIELYEMFNSQIELDDSLYSQVASQHPIDISKSQFPLLGKVISKFLHIPEDLDTEMVEKFLAYCDKEMLKYISLLMITVDLA